MHGVLNLLKPPGMTSHDAVAFVRRVLKLKRVGHIGTLDPAAAGVLPICVGQATRLVENLQAGTKEYLAEATFGFETDTLDAVGETVRECDASGLELETLRAALDKFRGEITQTPPMHSAIKVDGQKLYDLARAGQTAEIPTRQVTISKLFVDKWLPGQQPRALIRVECSGGTYIRSLVRDIGRELGLAATMTFLVRTRSGAFELENAISVEEFAREPKLESLESVLNVCAQSGLENDDAALWLWQGKTVDATNFQFPTFHDQYRSLNHDDFQLLKARQMWIQTPLNLRMICDSKRTLFALAFVDEGILRPEKVFDLR